MIQVATADVWDGNRGGNGDILKTDENQETVIVLCTLILLHFFVEHMHFCKMNKVVPVSWEG